MQTWYTTEENILQETQVEIVDSYPLTPLQEGMLFHSLAEPQSGVYIEQITAYLKEELNIDKFVKAWEKVIDNHPILRSQFKWENLVKPLQEVCLTVTLPVLKEDWQHLSEKEQEDAKQKYLLEDRKLGFEMTNAPLMRLAIFQKAPQYFWVVWTFHHILLDGRSITSILKEVFKIYEARNINEIEIPTPTPYKKRIEWLQKQDWSKSQKFWQNLLKGFSSPTPLIRCEKTELETTAKFEKFQQKELGFSRELTEQLNNLAGENNITPNTLVQAAWALLLSRYTGEEDIVFGATRACRHSASKEDKSMIGLLINTVPMRVTICPEQNLLTWLKQIRNQWVEIRPHENTPLVKIQEGSEIAKGTPLFETLLVFEHASLNHEVKTPGGNWENRRIELHQQTNFPLTLAAWSQPEMHLKIEYNPQLFDEQTISQMLGNLKTILESIAANPKQKNKQICLLTEAEKQQILINWNNTKAPYPHNHCLHQLFEEQTQRTPNAIAIIFADSQITYSELNQRANKLAHYLQQCQVKAETPVGILLDRSPEMIVAILGVLKAGGAYVPLDPEHPEERINLILEDIQLSLSNCKQETSENNCSRITLITQHRHRSKLAKIEAEALIINIDSDWETIATQNPENPSSNSTAHNLAYIIYTSGSTGKPKGVMLEHQGVCNEVWWRQNQFPLTGNDRVLQTYSVTFDPSVWQIFWPLIAGATIVLAKPGGQQDPAYLAELIALKQITVAGLPPVLLRFFLEVPGVEACRSLRYVECGGEAMTKTLRERFYQRLPHCPDDTLRNHYGPTEATIDCTAWICRRGDNGSITPIGRPLANTQIYILDNNNLPVPVGVAGELHIGGAGLARGYLNQPETTAAKFIPNLFETSDISTETSTPDNLKPTSSRLYKTGDRARFLRDGSIEFLGRSDYQVKIRGFRIELGEIEQVLQQHPSVAQAVVATNEVTPGDKRLVAYIVPKEQETDSSISSSQLRNYLKQKLPAYMVPSVLTILPSLPLTSTGKIDRRALPTPDWTQPETETTFVAPRTTTEEKIATIWGQVLGRECCSVFDNFFDLGGHSLLATQVISRLQQTFGVECGVRLLFENPTIAELASNLEANSPSLPENQDRENGTNWFQKSPKQLEPMQRPSQIPLSFAQQRLWFIDQLEPGNAAYHVPAILQLRGRLNIQALTASINEIVRRHEVLRTCFKLVAGAPVQIIQPELKIELPLEDLQSIPEDQRQSEAQNRTSQEIQQKFDLSTGPLVRVRLLRLTATCHWLVVTMHHIVSDGWSVGVFLQELSALYQAFCSSESSPLPELPVQYTDFAIWQRQWLQGEDLEAQIAYGKKQLGQSLPVLDLPTDRPRPPIQTTRGERCSLTVSKPLLHAIKQLCRRQEVTLFMTLLAAFEILLCRHSGQEDIVIGSPVAGRNHTEIESLIGFFINTVVLRTDLSGNPRFSELLLRVREVALGAFAHQDLPFDKLVEVLQPERDLSRHPIFQVWFNLLSFADNQIDLPQLEVEMLPHPELGSKFDLTFYAEEKHDELAVEFVYNPDLFDRERMEEMLGQFQHLLQQIVEDPSRPIGCYSLVTPKAQKLLPDPVFPLAQPHYKLLTQMLLQWQNSDQVAVNQGEQNWTYRELIEKGEKLGKLLGSRGVKPKDTVAVTGERSFGLIASSIGVFFSGGVLLMLDPILPDKRKQLMLEVAKAKILLRVGFLNGDNLGDAQGVGEQETESQTAWENLEIIDVDLQGNATVGELQGVATLPPIAFEDPAYIFFTSGTTGTPKGVLGCHKGLAHFLTWQRQTFGVGPQDRTAQLTGLSFDVVLRDIFLPLTSGATLCLPEKAGDLTPGTILPWMEKQGISLLHTVPTLAQSWLVNVPAGVTLASLRCVFFAGEPLTEQLVNQWRQAFPQAGEIVNLYGPTETTLAKCFYRVPVQEQLLPVQPVGRPICETQALVLGGSNQLCGIGESGEIVIRTPFRSFGYINASAADQERFFPNPFRKDSRDLLYRTGDRGRYRLDGDLEILGRIDHQVKIRGVRIEPGEIEQVALQLPQVQQVVVVAREDVPGDKRLVAYLVPKLPDTLTVAQVREFLKQKLPDYMMPSAVVLLDKLPMTPNGKVDRRALPAPMMERGDAGDSLVLPQDELELSLVKIWQSVLGMPVIGVKDNFFDLGGHSLLAVRLFAEIEKVFGKNLSITTLFQAPTVEQLAAILRSEGWQAPRATMALLNRGGDKPPLFCIYGVLLYQQLAGQLESDGWPVYGMYLQAEVDLVKAGELEKNLSNLTSVPWIAREYIKEIREIQAQGPYYLAGESFGGLVAFEMARQLIAEGEKVAFLGLLDSRSPLTTKKLPLSRRLWLHGQNLIAQGFGYGLEKLQGRIRSMGLKWRKFINGWRYKQLSNNSGEPVNQVPHQVVLRDVRAMAREKAVKNYSPEVYSGKVTLFRAMERSVFESYYTDPKLWESLAGGGLEVYEVPGDHLSILKQPHVSVLADYLKNCLHKSQKEL